MHLREDLLKAWKIFALEIHHQQGVRIKSGSAGWEARMMPLCYVVPCLSNIVITINNRFLEPQMPIFVEERGGRN